MKQTDIITTAIATYAAMHPRPTHVNQKQAAEMVGVSEPTIRKMIRAGNAQERRLTRA